MEESSVLLRRDATLRPARYLWPRIAPCGPEAESAACNTTLTRLWLCVIDLLLVMVKIIKVGFYSSIHFSSWWYLMYDGNYLPEVPWNIACCKNKVEGCHLIVVAPWILDMPSFKHRGSCCGCWFMSRSRSVWNMAVGNSRSHAQPAFLGPNRLIVLSCWNSRAANSLFIADSRCPCFRICNWT